MRVFSTVHRLRDHVLPTLAPSLLRRVCRNQRLAPKFTCVVGDCSGMPNLSRHIKGQCVPKNSLRKTQNSRGANEVKGTSHQKRKEEKHDGSQVHVETRICENLFDRAVPRGVQILFETVQCASLLLGFISRCRTTVSGKPGAEKQFRRDHPRRFGLVSHLASWPCKPLPLCSI